MGRRYSNEEKSSLIENWQQGSLSKNKFCKKHGVTPTTFYKWTKAYSSSESKNHKVPKEISFVEFQPPKEPPRIYSSQVKLTITTSNGTKMEFEL